jgi:hypothetical protein
MRGIACAVFTVFVFCGVGVLVVSCDILVASYDALVVVVVVVTVVIVTSKFLPQCRWVILVGTLISQVPGYGTHDQVLGLFSESSVALVSSKQKYWLVMSSSSS